MNNIYILYLFGGIGITLAGGDIWSQKKVGGESGLYFYNGSASIDLTGQPGPPGPAYASAVRVWMGM